MVVWRVGADAGVRVGAPPPPRGRIMTRGQVLDVDLVHDAGARRDDLEVVEGALAPAQELVALAVALVLESRRCARRRSAVPKTSAMTEWSMTISAGESGLTLFGSPPRVGDGLTHGGEVDDAGHTGEVLHEHAGAG